MHYYQHNIGDYARDTGHLSVLEHGIYRLLLDWCYLNEKPITTEQAMRVGRGNPVATQSVLSEFFCETSDGWTHKRVCQEVADYHKKADRNRANGAKNTRKEPTGNPVATQSVSENNPNGGPNHKPITNNQEPYSVPKGTGADAPTDRDLIFATGVPLLTAAGVTDKNARSMLAGLAKKHGDATVADAIRQTAIDRPVEPVSWLQSLMPSTTNRKPNAQEALEESNRAVVARYFKNKDTHESA